MLDIRPFECGWSYNTVRLEVIRDLIDFDYVNLNLDPGGFIN